MYMFLSGLLKIWRRNSSYAYCNPVTKWLGEKTFQKSHNVELQVYTSRGKYSGVSPVNCLKFLDDLASLFDANLFSLDITIIWDSTVGHLLHLFLFFATLK